MMTDLNNTYTPRMWLAFGFTLFVNVLGHRWYGVTDDFGNAHEVAPWSGKWDQMCLFAERTDD